MKKIALAFAVVTGLGLVDMGISPVQAAGSFGFYIGSGRHHSRHHGRHRGGHYDWHNTSHYDWHPGRYFHHGNHFDYSPGHYDWHSTGHYDYHRGGHGCHRYW
jgi:hypothetical protein